MSEPKKYTVLEPYKLKSWERHAREEIFKWLTNDEYVAEINKTTMTKECMGDFTKFLYHFAFMCNAPWGVLVDFNERSQRLFLPDHYYKWMHKLRDEMELQLNQIRNQ